jgi:enediyne biosynthesis protein E4
MSTAGRKHLWIAAAMVAVAIAAGVVSRMPLFAQPSERRGLIRFENRQPSSGVEFVLNNGTTLEKPIIDTMLGGVALLDYDNDGWLDIFFTNGARIPSLSKDSPSFYNRLYHNNHDGTFTDVTAQAGVAGGGYSIGVAVGDYDNDGYPDLYVAGVNTNTLYHNNRNGTFSDVTRAAGVGGLLASGKKAWAVGAAWLDYDNDGRLDLFVVNYVDWSVANNKACGDDGWRLSCSPLNYDGLPNILYHNNGDGTFTDVSGSTGISAHVGKGMGTALADYDGDGYIDIFVGNDSERNYLFHNQHGRSFAEVGVEAAVAYGEDGIPVSSMGADFRDLNDDGLPDLTIAALSNETFPVFLNAGKGMFVDVTYRSGMGTSSYTMSGWGIGAFDFDNDGRKDIFTSGSHVSENIEHYRNQKYKQPNGVWRNEGSAKFRSVSSEAGPAFQKAAAHRGVAFGDLNNDGRVDAVVTAIGAQPEILFNTSTRENNWIVVIPEGSASTRDGIGTRLRLTSASGVQYNHVTTCVGYASASDRRVYFGLGKDRAIREIELLWPSGRRQVLKDVSVNQFLRVKEP